MEAAELARRIVGIKTEIDDAFETGKIDFDKISTELEALKNDIADHRAVSNFSEGGTAANLKFIKSEDYQ